MTRDSKKLKEYRERYKEKLQILGVKQLSMSIVRKCKLCGLGFSKIDNDMYTIKGKRRKYYHQKCWSETQY